MRARRRRAPAVAALASLAVLANGCADPGPPPAATTSRATPAALVTPDTAAGPAATLPTTAEVFRDTRTFALAAASGRAEGTLPRGRQVVRVELEGTAAGANQHVLVEAKGAGIVEVLTVDGRHWLSGDVDFWRDRGKRVRDARAAAGGWHGVSEARARQVAPWTLRTLLTQWFADPDVAALESVPLVVARDEAGDRELWVLGRPGGPRLWVAADGSGELVRLVRPGRIPTEIGFSGWERVEPRTAPAPGEVLSP